MVSVAWALAAALSYGLADFLAGMAGRRESVIRVTLLVYAAGLVTVIVILPWTDTGRVSLSSLLWGGLSGIGLGAEALALIAGFRLAPFSIAGPLSAVVGAALAVVAGLLLGDRPGALAWAGVVLAMPAIVAVSASSDEGGDEDISSPPHVRARAGRIGVILGLAAGTGTAVSLIGLSQAKATSGVWPVLAVQVAALATVGGVAAFTGNLRPPAEGSRGLSGASGIVGACATLFYLLSVQAGLLAVAAVLTSLFPVVTVALAVALADERLGRTRLAGLLLAAISVALISLG
jgi:drug/metabolite transporter (DMT)-like permease